MSDPKQVLVVRTRYPDGKGGTFRPRMGKLISQACHGSLKVFLDRGREKYLKDDDTSLVLSAFEFSITEPMQEWLTTRFTKIVLQVESEAELEDLYAKALAAEIPCALIIDAGQTEFIGPEKTVVAIGPDWPEKIDPITSRLKLL